MPLTRLVTLNQLNAPPTCTSYVNKHWNKNLISQKYLINQAPFSSVPYVQIWALKVFPGVF